MFKRKKKAREIRDRLEEFQQTVNKEAGNQHLQFTAEILTTEENSPTPEKEVSVQIMTNDGFPFLNMKMRWPPEGDLQFGALIKKGEQLK